MMRATDFCANEVNNTIPDKILEKNHYLRSTPAGARHRYLLILPLRGIYGAAMWGRPVARNEDQETTLELTRFWTNDLTPKNTESYFLGQMIRDLDGKNKYRRLIAYASIGQGHEGTIYKATNWELVKKTRGGSWENREGRIDRDTSPKLKFEYIL